MPPSHLNALRRIPRGVWALGFVSMLMDLSSELIHSLLPLYMAIGLGASTLTIGIVEGIAEATAMIVKFFSGVLSDYFRKRKPLVVLGYGLAGLTKFVFPLAPTLGWIVAARFADRVGKGIRGAPRDALIADLTPADLRGGSFGLRQALDTVGGVGGPLLAVGAMAWFASDFKAAFWIAVVPACCACSCSCSASRNRRLRQQAPPMAPRAFSSPTCGASGAAMRSSSASRRCSRSRASRRRSSSCGRKTSACRPPWRRG
jgi:hypothetical protein